MDTHPGTVTVWQSGRLAPHLTTRRFDLAQVTREQWLGAGLLLVSCVVMAVYINVLQRDVSGSEMEHMAQRSRAIAEARCEADKPAERRGDCIALFNGDVAAIDPAAPAPTAREVRDEQANAARAMQLSLLGR